MEAGEKETRGGRRSSRCRSRRLRELGQVEGGEERARGRTGDPNGVLVGVVDGNSC